MVNICDGIQQSILNSFECWIKFLDVIDDNM